MFRSISILFCLAALLLPASGALAQTATTVADVTRDGVDLEARIAQPPTPTLYNTALVLTSRDGDDALVVCKAFDQEGNRVGIGHVKVPSGGLRYALASDLTGGRPFLGQVTCKSRKRLVASSFLLGGAAGVTAGPASTAGRDRVTVFQFPVVLVR